MDAHMKGLTRRFMRMPTPIASSRSAIKTLTSVPCVPIKLAIQSEVNEPLMPFGARYAGCNCKIPPSIHMIPRAHRPKRIPSRLTALDCTSSLSLGQMDHPIIPYRSTAPGAPVNKSDCPVNNCPNSSANHQTMMVHTKDITGVVYTDTDHKVRG